MQNPTGNACAAAPRFLKTLGRAGSLRAASGRFLKTLGQNLSSWRERVPVAPHFLQPGPCHDCALEQISPRARAPPDQPPRRRAARAPVPPPATRGLPWRSCARSGTSRCLARARPSPRAERKRALQRCVRCRRAAWQMLRRVGWAEDRGGQAVCRVRPQRVVARPKGGTVARKGVQQGAAQGVQGTQRGKRLFFKGANTNTATGACGLERPLCRALCTCVDVASSCRDVASI